MKMPAPIWPMVYSASRRKHHHRCQTCRKIVRDGEAVLMVRVPGRKTRAVHDTDACARTPLPHMGGVTMARLMELHGLEYLAACGFAEATKQLDEQRRREIAARKRA